MWKCKENLNNEYHDLAQEVTAKLSKFDIYQKMKYNIVMNWKIIIPTKVGKQILKLPKSVQAAVLLLVRDLEYYGPGTGGGWKNYSKLKGMGSDKRHCHLSKGRPTYVCCWEVINKELRITEIYYVGTHEKAPY